MGVFSIIGKVLALKPVEVIISKLLGKVLGQGDGGSKMAVGLSVAAVLAVIITIAKLIDPGLGAILEGHEVGILGGVAAIQAIYMYYRKEEVL
jgi:hypothetical protein